MRLICEAISGLSISRPISVLRWAERGSKLNEPTKMRSPSTAKVFACRLEPELPGRLPEPTPDFPPEAAAGDGGPCLGTPASAAGVSGAPIWRRSSYSCTPSSISGRRYRA